MPKTRTKNTKKIATTWLRNCSGCHIKMFDLQEEFINHQKEIDVSYITVVNGEDMPDVDIGIIEGAVTNEYNERILEKFRKKSKIIIAFGTCACFGDLPGLRNSFLDESKKWEREKQFNTDGLCSKPKSLHEIVPVDYYIPGCPPPFKIIKETIFDLLEDNQPKSLELKNICSECGRKRTKPFFHNELNLSFESFYTVMKTRLPNPQLCFLDQGILCLGNTTRNGCGSRCIKGNIPCWGCRGPIIELPPLDCLTGVSSSNSDRRQSIVTL